MVIKYIRDHQLKAGDRFSAKRTLAELFDVGRPVDREAVRVLSMMNVIEICQQGEMLIPELDEYSQLVFSSFT